MTTAAASSSIRRQALGILLFMVCIGRPSALVLPLVQGFSGLPPAALTRTSRGLFLAVPTATLIDEVIATGDEDGAIAEVMTMTDVVPTKKSKMPLATSITEVLTTEGELTAVAAAQKPGRFRRIWRRLRGHKTTKKTETETTTTKKDEDENNDDEGKKIGAGIRLNPDFIDRTATTDKTDAKSQNDSRNNKPQFVGGVYSTTITTTKETNKKIETQENAEGDAAEKEDTTDDSTVAGTVEPNREKEKVETKTPIVADTTAVVIDDKETAKAVRLQQKKDRAAATKRKQQEKAAANAQRLAERRAVTRKKIEAKAAATAAARLAAAQTSSLAPTTSSSSSFNLDEMEDETRNGLIVVAVLGVLWLANL